METLHYKDNQELVKIFCKDCQRRERRGCKDVEPMNCEIVKGYMLEQQENGYQVAVGKFIVTPKKNLEEYREFTDDDLDLIRDLLANHMCASIRRESAEEILKVINVCQAKLNCPTFRDVKQFFNNTSNKWTEIKEGGES